MDEKEIDQLRAIFSELDRKKRDFLDYDEFMEFLEMVDRPLTQDQKDRCFLFVNTANDGRITFGQFSVGVQGLHASDFEPELTAEQLAALQPTLRPDVDWSHLGTIMDVDPNTLYDLVEEVGKGAYGAVHRGIRKSDGATVAVKIIDVAATDDDLTDIQNEVAFQKSCDSEHIPRFYDSYIVGTHLWIVMEYLGGGALANVIKRISLTEHEVRVIARQLLLGLAYLHSCGKAHRDVKADNVMLTEDGRVKLADFGVACDFPEKGVRETFVGTPLWMAPEVILHQPYNVKVDIWSFGITLIELAQGHAPMHELHPMRALFLIAREDPPVPQVDFSDEFKDLVAKCLQKDPAERLTAALALRHPFFSKHPPTDADQELIADLAKRARKPGARRDNSSTGSAGSTLPTTPMSRTPSDAGSLSPAVDWWKFDVGATPEEIARSEAALSDFLRAHDVGDAFAPLRAHRVHSIDRLRHLTENDLTRMGLAADLAARTVAAVAASPPAPTAADGQSRRKTGSAAATSASGGSSVYTPEVSRSLQMQLAASPAGEHQRSASLRPSSSRQARESDALSAVMSPEKAALLEKKPHRRLLTASSEDLRKESAGDDQDKPLSRRSTMAATRGDKKSSKAARSATDSAISESGPPPMRRASSREGSRGSSSSLLAARGSDPSLVPPKISVTPVPEITVTSSSPSDDGKGGNTGRVKRAQSVALVKANKNTSNDDLVAAGQPPTSSSGGAAAAVARLKAAGPSRRVRASSSGAETKAARDAAVAAADEAGAAAQAAPVTGKQPDSLAVAAPESPSTQSSGLKRQISIMPMKPRNAPTSNGGQYFAALPTAVRLKLVSFLLSLEELLHSEELYLEKLNALMNVFIKPLHDKKTKPSILADAKIELIFPEIPAMVIFSTELTKQLLDAIAGCKSSNEKELPQAVAKALDFQTKFLGLYDNYAKAFAVAMSTLRSELADNKRFREFVNAARFREECANLSLYELLLQPIQRISHYDILVGEMRKKTGEPLFDQALATIHKLLPIVAYAPENSRQLMNLEAQIEKCPPLVKQGRSYVTSTEATKLTVDKKGAVKERKRTHLFLLSDMVLICKPPAKESDPSTPKTPRTPRGNMFLPADALQQLLSPIKLKGKQLYTLKALLPRRAVTAGAPAGGAGLPNCLAIKGDKTDVIIEFPNAATYTLWADALGASKEAEASDVPETPLSVNNATFASSSASTPVPTQDSPLSG